MNEDYKRIKSYIDSKRDEMMALWERIVNTESGSRQIEGVNKVNAILKQVMEDAGIATRTVAMPDAGDILIGEWNTESSAPALMFVGHMDTVFKPGAAAENPFRVDEEGHVHGPGCLDMKPGLIIGIYVVKALQSIGWNKRPIKLVYVGDEENLHMFSNARDVLAEECKGCLAAFNYETGYLDDRLVVGRKGGAVVHIDITGVAAHSGIAPEKGRSAILEAAHKIIALEAANDYARGKLINCGMVNGGIGENTVPGSCTIRIAGRFPSVEIRDEILDTIRAVAAHSTVPDTTAEVKVDMLMDCMETTDGVKALFEHIRKTAEDCGYGNVGSFVVGGVSDSGATVTNGVPTVCAMGPRGQGNHTKDEFAVAESIFERCYLAACAACTLEDDFDK